MELFKNEFVTYNYYENKSLIVETWNARSEDMEESEIKEIMLKFAEWIKTYKPKFEISDFTNFKYIIVPTLQKWIDEKVAKVAIENGLQKKANVISPELFSQVSVEQTLDEKHSVGAYKNEYFETLAKAEKWIME